MGLLGDLECRIATQTVAEACKINSEKKDPLTKLMEGRNNFDMMTKMAKARHIMMK